MRHALFLPPTGDLANPAVHGEIAAAAEDNGWDALFLWDHVLRPAHEPQAIADPWICLAVAATTTERIRLGTMVTPITRRRPIKLARETVSLDHLSNGRLIVGLGLGVDSSGELSKLGEVLDARERGERLDEGAELLASFWTGKPTHSDGTHFVADGVTVLPTPVQQPRIPLWFAARAGATKPVRRAARYDGLFPVQVDRDSLAAMIDIVIAERGSLDGFDIAAGVSPTISYEELHELEATWAFAGRPPGVTVAEVMALAGAAAHEAFT